MDCCTLFKMAKFLTMWKIKKYDSAQTLIKRGDPHVFNPDTWISIEYINRRIPSQKLDLKLKIFVSFYMKGIDHD